MLRPLPNPDGGGSAHKDLMDGKSLIGVMRIPKSGSISLTLMMKQAFEDRRFFELPTSLVGDMGDSPMQRLRACRSQSRHLLRRYRTLSMAKAIRTIEHLASDGDVVGGGHIDHATFCRFTCPVRYVVLFREPVARFVSEYNYSRAGYFKKKRWLRFDAAIKAKKVALPGTTGTPGGDAPAAPGTTAHPLFVRLLLRRKLRRTLRPSLFPTSFSQRPLAS